MAKADYKETLEKEAQEVYSKIGRIGELTSPEQISDFHGATDLAYKLLKDHGLDRLGAESRYPDDDKFDQAQLELFQIIKQNFGENSQVYERNHSAVCENLLIMELALMLIKDEEVGDDVKKRLLSGRSSLQIFTTFGTGFWRNLFPHKDPNGSGPHEIDMRLVNEILAEFLAISNDDPSEIRKELANMYVDLFAESLFSLENDSVHTIVEENCIYSLSEYERKLYFLTGNEREAFRYRNDLYAMAVEVNPDFINFVAEELVSALEGIGTPGVDEISRLKFNILRTFLIDIGVAENPILSPYADKLMSSILKKKI